MTLVFIFPCYEEMNPYFGDFVHKLNEPNR
jgi:hypothetical protein